MLNKMKKQKQFRNYLLRNGGIMKIFSSFSFMFLSCSLLVGCGSTVKESHVPENCSKSKAQMLQDDRRAKSAKIPKLWIVSGTQDSRGYP
jgi:hypothetical protein